MARPNRLKLEKDGAVYHVMTRTVAGSFFFEKPEFKEKVYKRILQMAAVYYVDLYSVAVLGNHYHILLSVRKPEVDPQDIKQRFTRYYEHCLQPKQWVDSEAEAWHRKLSDLSAFMKDLNQSIAMTINQELGNRGHVWGSRFKSVLVEDGPGLLACAAYIELNCVRAGIVKKPSQYRWCSSGRFAMGGRAAAGVKFPKVSVFSRYGSRDRLRAFSMYVDHLAALEKGEKGAFPCELAELDKLMDEINMADIMDVVFKRTKWATLSLVIGSREFCQQVIDLLKLRKTENRVLVQIGQHMFNSHQRPGKCLG